MADLLGRILPVFAVIAAGAVAGRFERFGERTATVLNDLVYWIALGCLVLLMVMIASMRRSRLGRALMASREGPIAARSITQRTSIRSYAYFMDSAASTVAAAIGLVASTRKA